MSEQNGLDLCRAYILERRTGGIQEITSTINQYIIGSVGLDQWCGKEAELIKEGWKREASGQAAVS